MTTQPSLPFDPWPWPWTLTDRGPNHHPGIWRYTLTAANGTRPTVQTLWSKWPGRGLIDINGSDDLDTIHAAVRHHGHNPDHLITENP